MAVTINSQGRTFLRYNNQATLSTDNPINMPVTRISRLIHDEPIWRIVLKALIGAPKCAKEAANPIMDNAPIINNGSLNREYKSKFFRLLINWKTHSIKIPPIAVCIDKVKINNGHSFMIYSPP